MHLLKIAVCNRKTDKRYKNQEMQWADLKERNRSPIRTTETVVEYPKLAKSKRDELKDHGGFVGGFLKNGERKNGNVTCRSVGTLDADEIPTGVDFISIASKALDGLEYFIYSTHSHTPQNQRYRIVILFSREVSGEEYPAVMRMVVKNIGMDFFDDTTYQANRMMYWASCPSNAEFSFHENEGKALNPDDYLGLYADWRDVSQWPVSSRVSEVIKTSATKQQDPTTKEGIIGAFCRAYSMTQAIDAFLPDVYRPSVIEGRYDFIKGESSAGVIIYDDKFSYSHHATDPACGKLLNAFDLVRIHRFGALDTNPETPVNRQPSFISMRDLALQDEKVKALLIDEKLSDAAEDFKTSNWKTRLSLDKKGNVEDSFDNILLILENDENLENIAYDQLRDGVTVVGSLPWVQTKPGWNDNDLAMLYKYISEVYGIYAPNKVKEALLAAASQRAFHPIKNYLLGLPKWDEVPRIESLYIDYFGAEDTPYTRAISRKILIAAVARIFEPGTKFDSIVIISGPQGIGKSTFYSKLGGRWFSDSLTVTDMKDKSGAEKLQGYWILELSELSGMRKADVETVKSFISRTDDKFRASYGVNVESHPRQCIIVGSTNADSGFLRDITGNRRFWPIKVNGGGKLNSWDMSKDTVEQIWAEALELYRRGENLYLEGEIAKEAEAHQSDAMESDEREGLVRTYLSKLLPVNWDSMDLQQRREFLLGLGEGKERRNCVCNMEIWAECFCKDPAIMTKKDSYEISAIMQRMEGWTKYKGSVNGTLLFPIYGKQRAFVPELVPENVEQGTSGQGLVPELVPDEMSDIPF